MPKPSDSSSTITTQRKYEVWKTTRDVFAKGVNFLYDSEGSSRASQGARLTDESRSFETALSNQPEVVTRGRNITGLDPPGDVPRRSEQVGSRDVAITRPVDRKHSTEGWERVEAAKPLPEASATVVRREDAKQKAADDMRRRTEEVEDRHRRQRAVERKLALCQKEKQNISQDLQRMIERLEASERRNQDLEAQLARVAEELKVTKSQLDHSEVRQLQTARLLDEKAAELKGANIFLTKADAMSSADVIAMVDGLNAEIMQLAAVMADALHDMGRSKESEVQAETKERRSNLRVVGKPLVQFLLDSRTPHLDPVAVQISLQLCLADTCVVILDSWRPGDWRGEDILWELYSSIKTSVVQSVVGRWRAIARSQTRYGECRKAVTKYFAGRVMDILSLAGWPNHLQENREILARFEARLEQIVVLTLRLHKAIGEDFTSGELRTGVLFPNVEFNPEAMEEAFPDDEKMIDSGMDKERRKVVGTTDLGLWRTLDGKVTILRKPKVILLSALQVMLGGQ
ncbi:hypothetical protein FPV67DRAFT_1455180 [Lyophyllum atratum]|nr:hypothetical protein FPV67DRAFT_1455180 [Lyophyllum atratum]